MGDKQLSDNGDSKSVGVNFELLRCNISFRDMGASWYILLGEGIWFESLIFWTNSLFGEYVSWTLVDWLIWGGNCSSWKTWKLIEGNILQYNSCALQLSNNLTHARFKCCKSVFMYLCTTNCLKESHEFFPLLAFLYLTKLRFWCSLGPRSQDIFSEIKWKWK